MMNTKPIVLVAAFGVSAGACNSIVGNDSHQLAPAKSAGAAAGAADAAGAVAEAGVTEDAGSRPGADSSPDDSGNPATPPDAAPTCMAGALQCAGDTPQACVAGAWSDLTACGGSMPVCSNGICGTYRAYGGMASTAVAAPAGTGIHLVAGAFELGVRTCTSAGMCVTGGIVP